MTPIRRFGIVDFVLFLYVVLLAGGVRAGYLALCADNAHNPGPLVVQDPASEPDLLALVRSVKDNNSFSSVAPLSDGSEETAHVSPGYPWALGLLARYVSTEQFDFTVRWIQCGLGALTAGLYYLFARRAFRSLAVGVLAGMLCGLHPFWVVDTAAINDGTLASFLVGLVLFTGARASQTGGPFTSLLYGLSLAGMALVRAALLPFAFVGLAWFLLRSRQLPSGWLGALLAFLGFVIGVAPWTIRNWQVYGEPTPIVDSMYLHLWMGNNPKADGGPVAVEDALPPEQVQKLKEIKKQPERYAHLGPVVWDDMRRDPPAVPQHWLQSGLAFFFGRSMLGPEHRVVDAAAAPTPTPPAVLDHVAQAGMALGGGVEPAPTNPAPNPVPVPEVVQPSYGAIFGWTVFGVAVLAVLGWRWSYGWRAESMPAVLAMIWIPLSYIVSHAEALSGPRLPLDGVLLCYTAFAVLCFVPGIRRYLLEGARAANPPPPR